jgi:hypothetical protein
METLIELISKVENDDTIKEADFLNLSHPLVKEISLLADEWLITGEGHCDWLNIHLLEDRRIHVFPVERDGFGWLVGGISTSKGVITYG